MGKQILVGIALGFSACRFGLSADPTPIEPLSAQLNNPSPAVRKAAVPQLIESLREPQTAYWACRVLGEMGSDAAPAAPALAELLVTDRRPDVRREAALSLGAIGPAAADTVPLLVKALYDPDYGVRMGAVFALGSMGPSAREAQPVLRRMSAEPQGGAPPLMKILLAWAIARVAPEDKQAIQRAVKSLVEAVSNREPRVRAAAVRGLADLHPPPETVVPAMTRILETGPKESGSNAMTVLADIGQPAVPALLVALRSSDGKIRREALIALGRIGPAARAAVPAATQSLKDPDRNVCYTASFALGKMGAAAAKAKQALQDQLEGDDPALRLAAAWALARIEPDMSQAAPKFVPRLILALKDEEPMIRLEAASSLRFLGPAARPAADPLKKVAAGDPNELIRDMAVEALRAIGD